ncbi:MAG: helix-turn-helix domain-containing protein [Bacteroidota bacterium]
MNLNPFDLLILIGLSQGLLFGMVVLFGKLFKDKINRFLAYAVIMISIIGLDQWLCSRDLDEEYYFIDFFGDDIPWVLLFYVPLFVYFLKSTEHRFANDRRLWLLTIPFCIFLVLNIIIDLDDDFGWTDTPFFIENMRLIFDIEYFLALFYNTVLCGISFFVVHQSQKTAKEKKWLKRIWLFVSLVILIWLIISLSPNFLHQDRNVDNYEIWLIVSIFIYWLIYQGLYQFNLAKDQSSIHQLLAQKTGISTIDEVVEPIAKSTIPDKNKYYFRQLVQLMEKEQLYRNPNLNRGMAAEKLGISAGYLSQILQTTTSQNFASFINTYRVEAIKKMLLDSAFDQYSLVAIGMEAGFKSKSAFYTSFKKETGMTPNQFKITQKES